MGKYEKAAEKIIKQQDFEQEQKDLREKYDVPENVIVKEKSNTFKFTVTMLKNLIKTVATILLIALAATGLMTLIYPLPREELMKILLAIYNDVLKMLF